MFGKRINQSNQPLKIIIAMEKNAQYNLKEQRSPKDHSINNLINTFGHALSLRHCTSWRGRSLGEWGEKRRSAV